MARRRHHYEQAFEGYLRARRVPYISVDEARKSLLPSCPGSGTGVEKLKNFDFLIHGHGGSLLVEVKGRRLPRVRLQDGTPAAPRMECWVTLDDIEALRRWRAFFGPSFEAVFVFMYWCEDVPPDGLFVETLSHAGRWYTMRCIDLESYASAMRTRSRRWGTVSLRSSDFQRLSRPFAVPERGGRCGGPLWSEAHGDEACTGFVREPVVELLGA